MEGKLKYMKLHDTLSTSVHDQSPKSVDTRHVSIV